MKNRFVTEPWFFQEIRVFLGNDVGVIYTFPDGHHNLPVENFEQPEDATGRPLTLSEASELCF